LCVGGVIDKRRHLVRHEGHVWEVDEFLGDNAGLVVAEIELGSPDEAFALPPWAGREVTDEPRHYNLALASRPYSRWIAAERGDEDGTERRCLDACPKPPDEGRCLVGRGVPVVLDRQAPFRAWPRAAGRWRAAGGTALASVPARSGRRHRSGAAARGLRGEVRRARTHRSGPRLHAGRGARGRAADGLGSWTGAGDDAAGAPPAVAGRARGRRRAGGRSTVPRALRRRAQPGRPGGAGGG